MKRAGEILARFQLEEAPDGQGALLTTSGPAGNVFSRAKGGSEQARRAELKRQLASIGQAPPAPALTLEDAGGDPAKLGDVLDFLRDPTMKEVRRP